MDVAESGHIYGNQPTSRRGAPSIPASSRPLSAAPASSKGRAASAGRVRPSSATPAAAAGGGGKGRGIVLYSILLLYQVEANEHDH